MEVRPGAEQLEPPRPAPGLSVEEVIQLVQAGLSEDLVIDRIKKNGKAFDLSTDQLLQLKKAGATNNTIKVMMNPGLDSRLAPPAGTAPPVTPHDLPKVEHTIGREIALRDGTEVKLRLTKPISSADARVEDRVEFEASESVLVDGAEVIKKGAPAVGKVIVAQPKKSFGRGGKLDFTIENVRAVDGQNIRLRTTRQARGSDSYVAAGVVTILTGPFGVFVKGKDVEFGAGTEFTIFIDGDRSIKLAP